MLVKKLMILNYLSSINGASVNRLLNEQVMPVNLLKNKSYIWIKMKIDPLLMTLLLPARFEPDNYS